MRKSILLTFLLCISVGYLKGQEGKKFTSEEKKYNDWAVAVYGGTSIIQGADLNSFDGDESQLGYDVSLVVTKQITHSFGLSLQYNNGATKQSNMGYGWKGETTYNMFALMADLNFSNMMRRIDNRSPYRWALHGYGGVGVMQFESLLASRRNSPTGEYTPFQTIVAQDAGFGSFFLQGGGGLRYKLSKKFDVELKGMYVFTGDEEFDGSGTADDGIFGSSPEFTIEEGQLHPSDIEEGRDDAMWTFSLGLRYKIGKKDKHLAWVDPLQELYKSMPKPDLSLYALKDEVDFCKSGDSDGDTICDDRDMELDTPAGIATDGQGRSPDVDKDGIPDHKDECPTTAGLPEKNGCPELPGIVTPTVLNLSDVLFDYDKATWRPESNKILNNALAAMRTNPDAKFVIEGHTDARGSASYNQRLSQRRATAIKDYFVKGGIAAKRITAIGKGESEPTNECSNNVKCSDEKHQENRRVLLFSDRQLTVQ